MSNHCMAIYLKVPTPLRAESHRYQFSKKCVKAMIEVQMWQLVQVINVMSCDNANVRVLPRVFLYFRNSSLSYKRTLLTRNLAFK